MSKKIDVTLIPRYEGARAIKYEKIGSTIRKTRLYKFIWMAYSQLLPTSGNGTITGNGSASSSTGNLPVMVLTCELSTTTNPVTIHSGGKSMWHDLANKSRRGLGDISTKKNPQHNS